MSTLRFLELLELEHNFDIDGDGIKGKVTRPAVRQAGLTPADLLEIVEQLEGEDIDGNDETGGVRRQHMSYTELTRRLERYFKEDINRDGLIGSRPINR